MKIKIILTIFILLAGIFTIFITVANAKSLNFIYSKKQNMIVILKDNANINKSKEKISEIPKIKIIKITDRNKEWSKMVNKMDLPKMDNPFKNEFIITIKKNTNITEIYNTIKSMDFVEDVKYDFDTQCNDLQK